MNGWNTRQQDRDARLEELDSRDRALVWRICGARSRYLLGGADRYVTGSIGAMRAATIALTTQAPAIDLATLTAEQQRLTDRLNLFGTCRDTPEIWRFADLPEPERVSELDDAAFLATPRVAGAQHDAR
ncbi:hypothetical protein KPL78_25925 [Roseomonas sp. HJA6]|uniref:Uncharacterized protein n=1 Tax=Roseomonas alba TaxID=2846776 RepID=A0ABS7AG83_9PROT|nr:hypothetical protein [Neoroseomonas alba]MBW6401322.1 hypothetical protein [Neoroseomonas alba]